MPHCQIWAIYPRLKTNGLKYQENRDELLRYFGRLYIPNGRKSTTRPDEWVEKTEATRQQEMAYMAYMVACNNTDNDDEQQNDYLLRVCNADQLPADALLVVNVETTW